MGTNSTGCTEWERDYDPVTEQPIDLLERDRLIYGWFRFGGVRKADLARHFGLSNTRIADIIAKFQRRERSHALWLQHGGPMGQK